MSNVITYDRRVVLRGLEVLPSLDTARRAGDLVAKAVQDAEDRYKIELEAARTKADKAKVVKQDIDIYQIVDVQIEARNLVQSYPARIVWCGVLTDMAGSDPIACQSAAQYLLEMYLNEVLTVRRNVVPRFSAMAE